MKMNYPKEVVEFVDGKLLQTVEGKMCDPQSIIDYAKWAYDQFRPRRASEEPTREYVLFWYMDRWEFKVGGGLDGFDIYLKMPPPPEPDPFEDFWSGKNRSKQAIGVFDLKGWSKMVWQSALEHKEKDKKE